METTLEPKEHPDQMDLEEFIIEKEKEDGNE